MQQKQPILSEWIEWDGQEDRTTDCEPRLPAKNFVANYPHIGI